MSRSASQTSTIGVPTEIKSDEHRVGLTPAGVRELVDHGHAAIVQSGAGLGSGFPDAHYAEQGASIAPDAAGVFDEAQLIVKVKEPQPGEVARLKPGQVLFTYLHLAPDAELTAGLLASGATCIAYETVRDARGRLPLLAPMSEVAGKIAAQAGATALEKSHGGRGILLAGVAGVAPARVMVIGAGVVGANATRVAAGMGADVLVFDRSIDRLRELDARLGGLASTRHATSLSIEQQLPDVDIVIGAVLVAGARAPHLVSRRALATMRPGAVLVDVSIDQGGCFETSRPTTHSAPTYVTDGIVHYCVANIPGAVPMTSTRALTNATLPYVLALAGGVRAALSDDPGFLAGLAVCAGKLTSGAVAGDQGREWMAAEQALGLLGD